MRQRFDSYQAAGVKRAIEQHARPSPLEHPDEPWNQDLLDLLRDPAFESAKPGDVWRLAQQPNGFRTWRRDTAHLPLLGLAITCPNTRCKAGVHAWVDQIVGPSWTWTGSLEDGTITADPMLDAIELCGWRGWLREGKMLTA